MALPRQVEQQLKEAEELEQRLQAPVVDEQTDEVAANPPDTPVTPEVEPTQPAEQPVHDDVWEQKYRTLQSKYDIEVPRLHGQLKDLSASLQAVQQMLAEQQAVPAEPEHGKLVTDKDVESFGEDLIDLQRRVAREVASEYDAALDSLRRENQVLREQMVQTGNQVSTMSFDQRLSADIPDFSQINADPRWFAWLDQVDPLLRAPRRVLAQQAFDAGDSSAMAHYVRLFKQSVAPQAEPDSRQVNRRAELERQVTPSRNASSAPTGQQNAQTYSTSDISAGFLKVSKLNSQQKYDEAAKLEAELSAAYVEGRVR